MPETLMDSFGTFVHQVEELKQQVKALRGQVQELEEKQSPADPEIISQTELIKLGTYGKRGKLWELRKEMMKDESIQQGEDDGEIFFKQGTGRNAHVYFYFEPFKQWFAKYKHQHEEELKVDPRLR